ncbi:hypothetical protein [Nocardia jejuensis]|uniref:hypothetical protein n=1 Tax=Nocardia jejuensis TaxID=328049 RepID=UPI0008368F25|nr:hypothetical protein [Nocardia jejuensis]
MTSGNDQNDPASRGPEPNWWQGAPAPESPWQSSPVNPMPEPGAQQHPGAAQHPGAQPYPPAAPPYPQGGHGAPGFGAQPPNYGAQQPDQGWQQGYSQPDPTTQFTAAGPYGQDPHQGQSYPGQPQPTQQLPGQPYPGQPQPTQQLPGQQPYQSGPAAYPPAQPPYGGQQGFGQPQPGYGAQPYAQPPGNGGRNKGWLFAGAGVLVVAIIGAIVTVVLMNKGSNQPSAQSNTTPSLVSALTTTPGASKPSTSKPSTTKTTGAAPVIPGYQTITIPENGAAFDVPKDWKVDRAGQTHFGSGADEIPIAGLAQDGLAYCPNYVRTNIFLSQSDDADPTKAAADIGAKMGRVGWSTSTGSTAGAAEKFSSSDGQLTGIFMETKGNAPPPSAGCASTYSIYTFAFPGDNGAFVLTIAADTGVDKAVDTALAKKILASIRPI